MKNPILRIIIALLLFLLAGFVLPSLLIVGAGLMDYSSTPPFIQGILMFIASVLIVLVLSKGNLKYYGFKWNWDFPLKKLVLISIAIGIFTNFFIDVILKSPATNTPWENWTLIDYVINTWIVASIAEETLTRGLVQSYLSPFKHQGIQLFGYQLSLPVIVGAVFFSLMHLVLLILRVDIYMVFSILLMALILGLMAGYHREKTGSLIPAIVIHTCFNVGGYLLTILM